MPPKSSAVFQKKDENPARKTTFASDTIPPSKTSTTPPVMISNSELFSVFQQVKVQMEQQQKTNQVLLREVEILKSERNKQPEVTTPLHPRMLEYGSSGFAGNYSRDYIRMQSRAETVEPVQAMKTTTTRDSGQYSGSGFQTSEFGNITNNRLLNTNYSEPMQDVGISPVMAKELQKLRDMISNVPGVVQPIPEVSTGSYRISRFAPPICDAEIPKRFQTPNMKLYDGTTDPEEHIAQYRERMEINPIPAGLKEACLCNGFGSTLTGSALKWLLNVPPTLLHRLLI